MAKFLVFTEYAGDSVKNVSLEILDKLGGHEADIISFNDLPANAKDELSKHGASKIKVIKGDGIDNYSPEGYANCLCEAIKEGGYDYFLAGATSLGKDLIPRLATKLDAGMASDIVDFNLEGDKLVATRPMFAGKCLTQVEVTGNKPYFYTVRPNALGLSDSPNTSSPEVSEVSANIGDVKAKVNEVIKGASQKADLTEASIIVSGGRSLKSAENFSILNELAEVIGATVGASRAAVDSGFADPSMQVGQTGKTVAPSLYMAFGISGAIQHLAGMRTSKVIVAVNTDPDAPIFSKADYGIVGDLFQIAPLFTSEFKNLLGK